MQQIATPAPARRRGAGGPPAPREGSDVVSVSPFLSGRSAMVEKRLIHGLLRFPLGEAAETRRPRW
jgi:hypothetical protein